MKKMTAKLSYGFLVVALLMTNITYGQRKYFKYLPDDSRIKSKCEQVGDSGLFFKNKTHKACDYVEEYFRAIAEDEVKYINSNGPLGWGLEILTLAGNQGRMKNAIRTILENETDDVKYEEFDKVIEAKSEIEKDRKEREEKEKQAEVARKEYEKKHPKF
jgi:hypothetical protein